MRRALQVAAGTANIGHLQALPKSAFAERDLLRLRAQRLCEFSTYLGAREEITQSAFDELLMRLVTPAR